MASEVVLQLGIEIRVREFKVNVRGTEENCQCPRVFKRISWEFQAKCH